MPKAALFLSVKCISYFIYNSNFLKKGSPR